LAAVAVDQVVGRVTLNTVVVAAALFAVGRTSHALLLVPDESTDRTDGKALLSNSISRDSIASHHRQGAILPQVHSLFALLAGILVAGHTIGAVSAGAT
jgi:hypothetical protein